MLWRLHPVISEINTVVFMATSSLCPQNPEVSVLPHIKGVSLGGCGFAPPAIHTGHCNFPNLLWSCMFECNSRVPTLFSILLLMLQS